MPTVFSHYNIRHITIKFDISLVCEQSLLNCGTISVKQKFQDTLRNASKISNDYVAEIITKLQKKGTKTVDLYVTCPTVYNYKRNISKFNRPFLGEIVVSPISWNPDYYSECFTEKV